MNRVEKAFGKELILDLHCCDIGTFTKKSIERFFVALCESIDMQREDLHFWDYEGDKEGYKNAPDHLKGISAIQFITTSSIVIHTLDVLQKVFINIFSCKDFDSDEVEYFCMDWFKGSLRDSTEVNRL